jgi:hypothetical protein
MCMSVRNKGTWVEAGTNEGLVVMMIPRHGECSIVLYIPLHITRRLSVSECNLALVPIGAGVVLPQEIATKCTW